MEKTIDIDIPEYLSIEQYKLMNSYTGDSELERMAHVISSLTDATKPEILKWPIKVIKEIANSFAELVEHKHEFHSIIEWNGTLYGYSSLQTSNLGEYIDIENYTKDLPANMHKMAATLYRPIVSHRFKSLKFAIKQKIKMVNNKVENVFDWYTVEPYDSDKRKLREEEFKNFPAHIFFGAVNFFLHTANQYSIDILFSQNKITRRTAEKMKKEQVEVLSQSTGAGGGLYIHSPSPIYLKLQEMRRSST